MPKLKDDTPHYWAIIDALPFAVLLKDTAKPHIFANKQALHLLSLTTDSFVLSLHDIRHIRLADPISKTQLSLAQNPLLMALSGSSVNQSVLFEYSGTTVQLYATTVQLSFTLSNSVLIVLTPESTASKFDIAQTERVDDTSELEEALAFDKLMSLISTELINVRPDKLDIHIEDALTALGEFCHADRSYVFLFDKQMKHMSNTHEWVRTGIKAHKENLQNVPHQALPYFWHVIQTELIFAISDVEQLTEAAQAEKNEFNAENIQSVLCTAMSSEGQLLGFVGCDMVARKRNWTASDIRRLKLVGNMIANTIQNVNYRLSLQKMQNKLVKANQELKVLAARDGLTGIANRRQFDEVILQELHRCTRAQAPLCLMLIDIDHFKDFNDNYGHLAGDDALKRVAIALQQQLKRQGELIARYGGEEFAVILPQCDSAEAPLIAKRLHAAIFKLAIEHTFSPWQLLTISIGYCQLTPDKKTSINTLIEKADTALYQAKAAGRNQVKGISL
ncbi:diguanylate cyclase [Alkalimonas collagenimarina]|uniref:diguanylate cyclase n=1 Tax=Alkalimonas collagenimarina TaxID=400390 RepID=A0ABT9H333_9GAMM|nr:diguanylate cyclase [Alkalimonas collagenimarina]MDP4537732.1 diguanylate cyclase [Alkalimonas collagenimarina]